MIRRLKTAKIMILFFYCGDIRIVRTIVYGTFSLLIYGNVYVFQVIYIDKDRAYRELVRERSKLRE